MRIRTQDADMELSAGLDALIGDSVSMNEWFQEHLAEDSIGALAHELLKKATLLMFATAGVYQGSNELPRDQAICAGLLTRMAKYMMSIAKLSAGHEEHGDAVLPLARCVLESSVDLRYLLGKDADSVYDRFIRSGLAADRRLYDVICRNVAARSGVMLVIESNMLNSIDRVCAASGLSIDDISGKEGNWGGSFRDKIAYLGIEDSVYEGIMGVPSHSTHGDWSDMIRYNLRRVRDNTFVVNYERTGTYGKPFIPCALGATEAAKAYSVKCFDTAIEPLVQRLNDMQDKLHRVDLAYDDWEAVQG